MEVEYSGGYKPSGGHQEAEEGELALELAEEAQGHLEAFWSLFFDVDDDTQRGCSGPHGSCWIGWSEGSGWSATTRLHVCYPAVAEVWRGDTSYAISRGSGVLNEIDFTKRMSNAPDEELLAVVSSTGFEPAAVEAAKAELAHRNINSGEVERLQAKVHRANERSASMPLGVFGKLMCFIFCSVTFIGAVLLRLSGRTRKRDDAIKWSAIGLVFWSVIGFAWGFVTAA